MYVPNTQGASRAMRSTLTLGSIIAVAAFAMVVVLALAGCSSNVGEGGGESTDFEAVSIKHALGTAEIKAEPQRVVTLGQGSAETAIALGVTPVAVEKYDWGADESGYLPWVKEAVEKKGDDLPALIEGQDKLSAEEILKYDPDLILAPWSGITPEQYEQLSAIAPTVAYPKEPWTITWQEQIETVATALGKADQADSLIEGIDNEFKQAAKPEYGETTFSFIYNSGPGTYGIFMPTEQRVAFVEKLGLVVDPVIDEFKSSIVAGTDSASISPENLNKLDSSDLIFTFYTNDDLRKELHADSTYSGIAAIARGSEVAPTDQSLVTASSMINPLSVPWVLQRYTQQIDEAIAKV